MFDIAWSELMVIAVVALVVIGPKDLPKAIYTLGKWVRKARVVARDFQGHIDDMMREAELDELRQQALKVRDANLKSMVENTIDPKGELKNAFDVSGADKSGGVSGHPGSPPEEDGAPAPAPASAPASVGSPQVAAAQPLPATEPPVTAPLPAAPPVEFTPAPAAAPAAAPAPTASASTAEPAAAPTTNRQA